LKQNNGASDSHEVLFFAPNKADEAKQTENRHRRRNVAIFVCGSEMKTQFDWRARDAQRVKVPPRQI
jgi:hypothetical protein